DRPRCHRNTGSGRDAPRDSFRCGGNAGVAGKRFNQTDRGGKKERPSAPRSPGAATQTQNKDCQAGAKAQAGAPRRTSSDASAGWPARLLLRELVHHERPVGRAAVVANSDAANGPTNAGTTEDPANFGATSGPANFGATEDPMNARPFPCRDG